VASQLIGIRESHDATRKESVVDGKWIKLLKLHSCVVSEEGLTEEGRADPKGGSSSKNIFRSFSSSSLRSWTKWGLKGEVDLPRSRSARREGGRRCDCCDSESEGRNGKDIPRTTSYP
jgi:hypothetical protein